jgi:aminobenzoyl-glutamate utilization protein B
MRTALFALVLTVQLTTAQAQHQDPDGPLKDAAIALVDRQESGLIRMSDQIWTYAETALAETRSAAVLADYAEQQGFHVERGIAGMPTAFVASYGEGEPIIGIVGEFDALPRLSQTATPEKNARIEGAAGHGCGHNLYGSASLGAATAIRQLLEAGDLQGTLRYYGTPAEESIGGKTYMAREGLFDDLDLVLSWHPGFSSKMDVSGSQAMVETLVKFKGRTAHAAADPWNGRSALDGLEIFTHALNLMREHVRPTVRMHYSIIDGGGAPNVVPESASAAVWIRDSELKNVLLLYERAQSMAAGAAMAADVSAEFTLISGTYGMLQNKEAAKIVYANMLRLGEVRFDESDQAFAKRLQEAMHVPAIGLDGSVQPLDLDPTEMTGGSTDLADVSWIIPTVDFNVATAPTDIPWHSWGVTAASGSAMGHKGMQYAAKVLAATAIELFRSPAKIAAIQAEFVENTSGFEYKAYVPDGPAPIPENP